VFKGHITLKKDSLILKQRKKSGGKAAKNEDLRKKEWAMGDD